jgi:MoaA/NifB/PqqE/SkfB family radical SAM enzyme
MVLGNIKKDSFLKIWTTQQAMLNRKNLNKAKRCFAPCDGCDVIGTLEGEKHAKAWDDLKIKSN